MQKPGGILKVGEKSGWPPKGKGETGVWGKRDGEKRMCSIGGGGKLQLYCDSDISMNTQQNSEKKSLCLANQEPEAAWL